MRRIVFLLLSCIVAISSCQKQAVELTVSESSLSFDTEVNTKKITISSNYPWTISVQAAWLSLGQYKGEAGRYTIDLTCSANNSITDRSTELRLRSEDTELSIKVFQEGRILKVQGMDNKMELDYTAQDFMIDVLSNTAYHPAISSSWISTIGTKATSVSTHVFHASRNNDAAPRTASIVFRSGASVSYIVEVTQAGSPVLHAMSHNVDFEAYGGHAELDLKCSDIPEVTYPEGVDWLSFSGCIEDGFTLTATENVGIEKREADIVLTLADLSENLHVTQAGAPTDPYIDFSGKAEATVSSEGGVLSFDVYSNTSIVLSGHSDWAEVKSVEREGSHYTVTVQVEPYQVPDDALTAFDDRSWTISITDSMQRLSDSFTIIQKPEEYMSLKLNMDIQLQKNLDVEFTGEATVGCIKVGSAKTIVENNKASVHLEPAKDVNVEICSRGADAVTFNGVDRMKIILNPESLALNLPVLD